ncbi:hypothetical protein N9250_03050, partial [bacterium]|nr:hypothetical protein [bacterium]
MNFRFTSNAMHSRVNSSINERTFSERPFTVRSNMKSTDQTWFGRSARRRLMPPLLSPKRRFFVFFTGTLS